MLGQGRRFSMPTGACTKTQTWPATPPGDENVLRHVRSVCCRTRRGCIPCTSFTVDSRHRFLPPLRLQHVVGALLAGRVRAVIAGRSFRSERVQKTNRGRPVKRGGKHLPPSSLELLRLFPQSFCLSLKITWTRHVHFRWWTETAEKKIKQPKLLRKYL